MGGLYLKRQLNIGICLLLALCVTVIGSASVHGATGDTQVKVPKKIISIAYDDSGSMQGDRWVYASYAMQGLAAQLNEQDELYITYMSRPDSTVKIDLSDPEAELEAIRKWDNVSDTPQKAVETARDKLKALSSSEAGTQFWLLILTDGVLQNDTGEYSSSEELKDYLDKNHIGNKSADGVPINVAYMSMGKGALKLNDDKNAGLYTFHAEDNSAIIKVMSDVSALMSSRITVSKINQKDGNTLSFTTSLPFFSFSVLSQNTSAKVVGASSSEQNCHIKRNLALDAFEPSGATHTRLNGNAAVIDNADSSGTLQLMRKGTYEVKFDKEVRAEDVFIQLEPAISIMLRIQKNGIEIPESEYGQLSSGDKVDITVIPVIAGTDEIIDDSDLPNGISWQTEYEVNGSIDNTSQSRTLTGVTLEDGKIIIRGIMTLPGYAPSAKEVELDIQQIVYNFGIETEQPDDLTYQRGELGGISEDNAVRFFLTNDGKRMTAEEIKQSGAKLTVKSSETEKAEYDGFLGFLTNLSNMDANCALHENKDGSCSLIPYTPVGILSFLVKPGTYTVEVGVEGDDNAAAKGTFRVEASLGDWANLFWVILILIALIYLIYIIFIKRKFQSGTTILSEAYKMDTKGGGIPMPGQAPDPVSLSPLKGGLLLPTRACSINYNGLRIIAGPEGTMYISGKSIANTVDMYGMSTQNPKRSLRGIVRQLRKTTNAQGKKEASDTSLGTQPIYFLDNEGDRTAWCIWAEQ